MIVIHTPAAGPSCCSPLAGRGFLLQETRHAQSPFRRRDPLDTDRCTDPIRAGIDPPHVIDRQAAALLLQEWRLARRAVGEAVGEAVHAECLNVGRG